MTVNIEKVKSERVDEAHEEEKNCARAKQSFRV